MSSHRSGVGKKVQDDEARAAFTHSYSHSLNLAACDAVKGSKIVKAALETTHEITKLIKLSPRREAIFREMNMSHLKLVVAPSNLFVQLDGPFELTLY